MSWKIFLKKESDQGEATWNSWIKEEEKIKELEKRRKTPEYKNEREEEKMKEEKMGQKTFRKMQTWLQGNYF